MTVLPWQTSQWESLTERIAKDRIPHAMLFHGPQGVGKKSFVTKLVARLFCQAPQDDFACGQCNTCHLLAVDNHPDLQTISCEDDKKNIAVDQIREVIEYVSLTPHSSRFKVAIIDQAELMTVNAANSLLKTLEEPPKSALIFLITHRPEQLLPTILSRCQKTVFSLPTPEAADQWLGQYVVEAPKRSALLALANGAPLRARELEEQGAIEERQHLFTSLQSLISGSLDPVSAAESWLKVDMELSLNSMISWVIDLARLKSAEQPPKITNKDLKSELVALTRQVSLSDIVGYHQYLQECLGWSKSNINSQLLLEDILIRWVKLFR